MDTITVPAITTINVQNKARTIGVMEYFPDVALVNVKYF